MPTVVPGFFFFFFSNSFPVPKGAMGSFGFLRSGTFLLFFTFVRLLRTLPPSRSSVVCSTLTYHSVVFRFREFYLVINWGLSHLCLVGTWRNIRHLSFNGVCFMFYVFCYEEFPVVLHSVVMKCNCLLFFFKWKKSTTWICTTAVYTFCNSRCVLLADKSWSEWIKQYDFLKARSTKINRGTQCTWNC